MEILRHGAAALGLQLTDQQVERFRTYYQALLEGNRRVNLTTVTDAEGVQRRHFLESLAVGAALHRHGIRPWGTPARFLDVGAGAGFPGLPIRLADAAVRLVLLEATAKKAAFLSHLTTRLGLGEVAVLAERAETAARDPAHRESYDIVLARAVAPLPALLELTLPFLRTGGVLAAPKGSGAAQEVAASARALRELGGRLRLSEPLPVPDGGPQPVLVLVEKVAPTPERYPRRPGVPTKRPL
ncbi:MAG TPA: 16S rRNA (guanine(527)-N(7))-methyltransferase RsmG [Dehalococcoidia bacterium]